VIVVERPVPDDAVGRRVIFEAIDEIPVPIGRGQQTSAHAVADLVGAGGSGCVVDRVPLRAALDDLGDLRGGGVAPARVALVHVLREPLEPEHAARVESGILLVGEDDYALEVTDVMLWANPI
jgi:hypothetical protein